MSDTDKEFTRILIGNISNAKELMDWGIARGHTTAEQLRLTIEARKEKAKELRDAGMSIRKIGKVLDTPKSTIADDLSENRTESVQKPDTKDEEIPTREQYEARKESGHTIEDLGATDKKYGVIYADPPWEFKVYSGKGKQRSADRHYDTQSLDFIKSLPVETLAADDCALFMWAVMPELPGALEVIKAWGFEYKTVGFTWVKDTATDDQDKLFWGMGYWTRANAELCLLATRGSPKRLNADVHQVILRPRTKHSQKPDEARRRIERLIAGPYLELFAREKADGWDAWGNEIQKEAAA